MSVRPLLHAVLLLPILAGIASAQVILVGSGLAADLQAAIDGAPPGATIKVSGGPYVGNFVIPAGKDGLRIQGKATIDAYLADNAFTVDSHGVEFRSLTIRHGNGSGIFGPTGIPDLEGLTVAKCVFIACGAAAVTAFGNDVHILGSVADGCTDTFTVIGDRAVVSKNTVLNSADDAVRISGDDALIAKNKLHTTTGLGVFAAGDRAIVSGNKITNASTGGIDVTGSSASIVGNTVHGSAGKGISAVGSTADVSKNKVRMTSDHGIEVAGLSAIVLRNTVVAVLAAADGINVNSGAGARIERNTVKDTSDEGLDLVVGGAIVKGNRVSNCGSSDDSGIFVTGNSNVLEGNSARSCEDTGVRITGTSNILWKNRSTGHGNNGFLVEQLASNLNTLDANLASGNVGEGIENGGVGTVLRDNTCKKNLQDIGNQTGAGASITDGGGNTFTTGGFTDEPKVIG